MPKNRYRNAQPHERTPVATQVCTIVWGMGVGGGFWFLVDTVLPPREMSTTGEEDTFREQKWKESAGGGGGSDGRGGRGRW